MNQSNTLIFAQLLVNSYNNAIIASPPNPAHCAHISKTISDRELLFG